MSRHGLPLVLIFFFLLVSGCATQAVKVDDREEIELETVQLRESRLLDVGILLFEKGEITRDQEKENIHEDIRAAESRYMAYHLKQTLERGKRLGGGPGAARGFPYCGRDRAGHDHHLQR